MASAHFSAQTISRGSGHSAVGKAAYNARATLEDERTGETHDYTRHSSKCLFEGIYAPKDAPAWAHDRAQLWNHVEAFERHRRAELAQDINIALPHELTLEQNRRLLQDWVKENVTRRGLIADVAIHAPDRRGDDRNIHAHVMIVRRKLDGSEFVRAKERFATYGEKDAARKADLVAMRQSWEKLANRHLERYGHEARIDMGRKQEGEATLHMGRHATAQERRGAATELGDRNRDIAAGNEQRRQAANQNARPAVDAAELRERIAAAKAHDAKIRDQIREDVAEHVRQAEPLRATGPEAERRAAEAEARQHAKNPHWREEVRPRGKEGATRPEPSRTPNPHWREEIRPRPNAPETGRRAAEPEKTAERPRQDREPPPSPPREPPRASQRPREAGLGREAGRTAGRAGSKAAGAAGKAVGGLMGVLGAVLGDRAPPAREPGRPRSLKEMRDRAQAEVAARPKPPPEKEHENDGSRSRFEIVRPFARLMGALTGSYAGWAVETRRRLMAYAERTGEDVTADLKWLDKVIYSASHGHSLA